VSPFKAVAIALLAIAASTAVDAAPTINVAVDTSHTVNRFDPRTAFGAGVDEVGRDEIARIYTPDNVHQMLSAGYGPLSYRLFTELSAEYWHWNTAGTWSAPKHQEGYFTGSETIDAPDDTLGYQLPYRGFTGDQGSNGGYSRLTDGDLSTQWKSNPYLSHVFTGEDDALHPQWVIVDLHAAHPVDAIHLTWGKPFATHYQVQYWRGRNPIWDPADGTWATFPGGDIEDGSGGDVTLTLATTPTSTEFVRILMTESSGPGSRRRAKGDIRTKVGYALAEIGVGTISGTEGQGTPGQMLGTSFIDIVSHAKNSGEQTPTTVSSVDPWHAASNVIDGSAQPGFDILYRSGITNSLPAMVAVGMLYNTPENAVAEIAYLEKRHYPISYAEMGEEPDGQYITPEDYGALYVQWAAALHKLDPKLKLGGPVLQSSSGVSTWPDEHGEHNWLKRFVSYLRGHGALSECSFYSCEHYPFNQCSTDWADLAKEEGEVNAMFEDFHDAGFPEGTPFFVTEFNFSAGYTPAQEEPLGAVWHADFVGKFLTEGGAHLDYYQYEPLGISAGKECSGTYSLFTTDHENKIKQPVAQFFSSQLINLDWCQPVDAVHDVYAATVDGTDTVSAYVLKRPDGKWSVMLVNRDPKIDYQASISIGGKSFTGWTSTYTFGPAQYTWHEKGADGYADPDGPIAAATVDAGASTAWSIPAGSIVVVVGNTGS